jgi:hypothetical protein
MFRLQPDLPAMVAVDSNHGTGISLTIVSVQARDRSFCESVHIYYVINLFEHLICLIAVVAQLLPKTTQLAK